MVVSVDACRQVDLLKIKNSNGVLTDYEDGYDSLAVWMGVSEDIMITYTDTIVEFEIKEFSRGIITMPCFNDSVLWVEIEEQDTF